MIVDDNEADRFLLARLLRKGGVTQPIVEAQHGAEAVDLLRQTTPIPRLLFVDVHMPVMDGFEFLAALDPLHRELGVEVEVLMMFSGAEPLDIVQRIAPFDFVRGHIVKLPDTPSELRLVMERAGVWPAKS